MLPQVWRSEKAGLGNRRRRQYHMQTPLDVILHQHMQKYAEICNTHTETQCIFIYHLLSMDVHLTHKFTIGSLSIFLYVDV